MIDLPVAILKNEILGIFFEVLALPELETFFLELRFFTQGPCFFNMTYGILLRSFGCSSSAIFSSLHCHSMKFIIQFIIFLKFSVAMMSHIILRFPLETTIM